jgi:hypothetical protein
VLERIRQHGDRESRTAEDADKEERGVTDGGRREEQDADTERTKSPARPIDEDRIPR